MAYSAQTTSMQKIVLSFIFLLFAYAGIAQGQKLYFNPKTAKGENQSKFIDGVKFIPLESVKGARFDTYTQLIVSARFFILFDWTDKRLAFFTQEGKYISTLEIKKYNVSNVRYDDVHDCLKIYGTNKNYTLTQKDLSQIHEDYANKANRKYFKTYTIPLQDAKNFTVLPNEYNGFDLFTTINHYDNSTLVSNIEVNKRFKDSLDYEIKLIKDNKLVAQFFPYAKRNELRYYYDNAQSDGMYASDTNYIKYITRPYDYIIYKLNKDSLADAYEIILPAENAIPKTFFTTGFKSKSDRNNFSMSNGKLFKQIDGVKNIGNYLYFNLRYFRSSESFIYDKKSSQYYATKKIKPDSSQYFVPILQNGFSYSPNGKTYSKISAEELLNIYNTNKEKNIVYPSELTAFFEAANKEANPVIIQFNTKY